MMNRIEFEHKSRKFEADLSKPIDISLPLRRDQKLTTFFLPTPSFETVREGGFVGDVNQGGSCNVENIHLSPHGNGTHTECVGHISRERVTIDTVLNEFHFLAQLISAPVETTDSNERVLSADTLTKELSSMEDGMGALIIRSLPNNEDKKNLNYSGTNPPFIPREIYPLLKKKGINHLLTDLPSLDPESDGNLRGHHLFFGYPDNPSSKKTVTELIYVPDNVTDGSYLLNLQVLSLQSDASPSRPVLFKISEIEQTKQ